MPSSPWFLVKENFLSASALKEVTLPAPIGTVFCTQAESSRVRERRRTALPRGSQSRFYGDGISFRVVFSQSFWLRVLPGGACLVQPRWMLERRILGGGRTCGVSFWPFLSFPHWWRLISTIFLTRTSSRKTTYASSYYGDWPGWKVSNSVLPLTIMFAKIPQIVL